MFIGREIRIDLACSIVGEDERAMMLGVEDVAQACFMP